MGINRKTREMQENRLGGMMYATKRIEEIGIEAFRKEMGGMKRLQLTIPEEIMRKTHEAICTRIYETMRTLIFFELHKEFGFGKKRLEKIKDVIELETETMLLGDPWGNNYVTFLDMGEELNSKYNLGINLPALEFVDNQNNEVRITEKRKVEVTYLCKELERKGFQNAADYIREVERRQFGNVEEEKDERNPNR